MKPKVTSHDQPAGGWGSLKAVGRSLLHEHVPLSGSRALLRQNKPDGFMCVSCAWAKPREPRPFEFCENGAKATTWEITNRRAGPEFFAAHTLAELETWTDHNLEERGRLTHPLRWDPTSDKYVPVEWADAFREIGEELKRLDPRAVVFYTSGRASLEASYMYQLFARLYGSNNLPDSSNMCHESTSVALPESIGVPVGTIRLEDFAATDGIFFFGQNVGTSSPRMLHELETAAKRGVPIVTFNPLRERGLVEFVNPQNPVEMLSPKATQISSQYHQLKAGGDTATMMGMCKALFALDERQPGVIDRPFIAEHCHGFESFAAAVNDADWAELERRSGLTRGAMEAAAQVYAHCNAAMGIYGMGVTQHRAGVETVQILINLLLLRGNMGRPGAGVLPVRGHSNVQGQRTVGISEKPKLVPLDKLAELYAFEPPRWTGLNTVDACGAILKGEVKALVSLGGNLVRSVPERGLMEPAWRRQRLTVQISTKLNRSHLIHGEVSYVLPCLGRIEIDQQQSGRQAVAMEDSCACIHGSRGVAAPASPHLLSEPKIIAELAKATLPPNPRVDWDGWVADYSRVRDAIEATYPDQFKDFNARLFTPGGFPRPLAARERRWNTETGKANFIVPSSLSADIDMPPERRDILQLITLRSDGQFNTTVYTYLDQYRGIDDSRLVLFMHQNDIDRLGLAYGETVTVTTEVNDGVARELGGLRIVPYNLPEGCCAGYYPECNVLIPLWHHADRSKVPAAKSIPVSIRRGGMAPPGFR